MFREMGLNKKAALLISLLTYTVFCFLAAQSNAERYDKILERAEREKSYNLAKQTILESSNISEEQYICILSPQFSNLYGPPAPCRCGSLNNNLSNCSETQHINIYGPQPLCTCSTYNKPEKWALTFEHEELPTLDGTWIMKKKSVKRIETPLRKNITHVQCNSRLPFEENPFEKEIVLSPQGQDFFVFRALYPATNNAFLNPNKTKTAEYQNFGFKGIVIPHEITYTYTLKLTNHLENPAFARQLWFNGKLVIKNISRNKISGIGYEVEYTPECLGFIRDEISFELVRVDRSELASRD